MLAGHAGRAGRGAERGGQLAGVRLETGMAYGQRARQCIAGAGEYLFVARAFGRRAMHSSQRRDSEGGVKIGSRALQRRAGMERACRWRTCTVVDR